MNYRVVYTLLVRFLLGILLVVAKKVGKSSAKRKVAGSVFVKESVVEQKSRLSYGRGVGNKRALAEIRRALVHINKLCEQSLVLLCAPFDSLSVLEANPELVYKLTAVGERLRGINNSVSVALHRRGEYFLCGNIRVVIYASAERFLAARKEESVGNKSNAEIGAALGLVV